ATEEETDALPSVNIDYYKAAYEVVQFYTENETSQPAFITGDEHVQGNGAKLEGYKEGLKDAGIPYNDEFVIADEECTYNGGIVAAQQLLKLGNYPRKVFVATDEMAVGVIHGIQDEGLKVPEDIEVIGFNNTRVAMMVRPTLSTVVQPMYDIGAVAMRLLTKYMNKEEVDDANVILPHRLITRDSTK